MTLQDLQPGQSAYVLKIRGRGAFRKRIIEMGFIRGRKIECIRKAPLTDPIEYRIMDYEVSLRRSEARSIEIVTLEDIKNKNESPGVTVNEEIISHEIKKRGREIDIALVGNPNCGKTTIFNYASGASEHVGNYSGVTVEAKTGSFNYKSYRFNMVDLPGTYSLSAYTPEELFVRKHLIGSMPDIVLNVIDSSNLERNLFLTTQLIELDLPVVVALNMYDELLEKEVEFNHDMLGQMLGIPFVPTVGHRKNGIENLLNTIIETYEQEETSRRRACIRFKHDLEESIQKIRNFIEHTRFIKENIPSRFYSIKLLENDKEAMHAASHKEFGDVKTLVTTERQRLESIYSDDIENLIAEARYSFIAGALKETYKDGEKKSKKDRSYRLDEILTHKFFGFPIFIAFLWLMFFSTFFLGSFPMNWLEQGVSFLGGLVETHMADGMLKNLIIDGIISGVGGVLVFLPNILFLFLFIAFMEDTGYMARVAFLMDKLMHKIGLHGKSFIPLIMGFGCNVPAIMATRTLENPSDRLLTILINPFMSCSARLPVYILIIAAVFPNNPVMMLFLVYMIGIAFAIIVALLFKKTIFRKSEAPFVMELPPYRMPVAKTVFRHMWFRASQYLKKMGGIILIASVIIWALGHFPQNFEPEPELKKEIEKITQEFNGLENLNTEKAAEIFNDGRHIAIEMDVAQQQNSYIGRIGTGIQPIMEPLGFDWRLTISLVTGIAAKEVVVSTLAVLFSAEPAVDTRNLNEVLQSNTTSNLSDRISMATHQNGTTVGQKLLDPVTGFAFLMFVLLYFPCVAVVAAIRKETGGWKWALFTVFYTTGLAWLMAFAVQQIGSLFF